MLFLNFNLIILLFGGINCNVHSTLEGQHRNNLTGMLLSNYKSNVIPDKPVNIDLSLSFVQLVSLDERNQIMSINGFLMQHWEDHRLRWNPNDYASIEYINIPAISLWLPDTHLLNSVSNKIFIRSEIDPALIAVVYYNGSVIINFPLTKVESRCTINTKKYPFDKQACEFILESWACDKNVINYNYSFPEFNLDSYVANQIWDYDGETVHVKLTNNDFYRVTYKLKFRRKPLYYMVNGIFPCFLLNIISIAQFLMPYDMQISVCLTCLLTFTVNSLVVMNDMPVQSDYLPYITIYFMMSVTYPFLSIFWFIYFEDLREKKKLPRSYIKVCKYLIVLFEHLKISRCKNIKVSDSSSNKKVSEDDEIEKQLKLLNGFVCILFALLVVVSILFIWLNLII